MRIFVISISGHERREAIKRYFHDLHLNFDFFDAVDGANITPEQAAYIDYKQAAIDTPRGMSNAEFGCALSHALVYKKIVDEQIPHAVIFEDDIIPTQDFKRIIQSSSFEQSAHNLILMHYNEAWCRRWSFKTFFEQYQSFKVWAMPFRTSAYYISQNGAQKMLRLSLPIRATADWPIGTIQTLAVGGLIPHPIKLPDAQAIPSIIGEERHEKQQRMVTDRNNNRGLLMTIIRAVIITFLKPKSRRILLPDFWLYLLGRKLINEE